MSAGFFRRERSTNGDDVRIAADFVIGGDERQPFQARGGNEDAVCRVAVDVDPVNKA